MRVIVELTLDPGADEVDVADEILDVLCKTKFGSGVFSVDGTEPVREDQHG